MIKTNQPTGVEIKNEVNELYNFLWWINPIHNPDCGKVEPPIEFRRAGMPAYADGVNWNPGAGGEGYYFYSSGGTWTKL